MMNRTASLLATMAIAVAGTAATGCVARASGHAHAGIDPPVVFTAAPTLVAVGAGVWVVRDHPETVYFVDGTYWHYDAGVWYRAASWDAETWTRVEVAAVPVQIVDRDHDRYANYSGPPDAEVRRAPPAHAAAQHGGPPGHADPPGLGNQRSGHVPPGQAKKDDDERPANPPGAADEDERRGPPEHSQGNPQGHPRGGPPGHDQAGGGPPPHAGGPPN